MIFENLFLIRDKLEEIKNKPHGPDVDFLIATIEMFLDDQISEKETSAESK